ncbi:MAG: cytochrome c3 family protein [Planctomycetota bacterium]|jgi:predicted CXXCH cytochrome family protein
MKRRATGLWIASAAVAGCLGAVTFGDIVGSSHDFSSSSWGGGEVCRPCHTPHFADSEIGFLWAHTMSTQAYTLYGGGGPTSDGGVNELDQFSRMCLSCHDGTVALNEYHGGGGPLLYIGEGEMVGGGGDLSDDHPIGITAEYPIDGTYEFNAATLTPSGFYGFGLGGGDLPEVPLFPFNAEQVVSCSTCHDPHAIAGIDHLLRKSNAGSALCLTCHIK